MEVKVTTIIIGLPEGQRTQQTSLTLPAATVTVRELLSHKVEQEVAEHAAQGTADDKLVATERVPAAGDYMVVIDNQRITDLDTVVTLRPDARIEFIRILPLVGG
jgi:hypothetical protein